MVFANESFSHCATSSWAVFQSVSSLFSANTSLIASVPSIDSPIAVRTPELGLWSALVTQRGYCGLMQYEKVRITARKRDLNELPVVTDEVHIQQMEALPVLT